jgi:phage gp16-like protein
MVKKKKKEKTVKTAVKKKKEVELSGVATPEQIAIWKKMHRDVFVVIATDKVGYLKRPDRKTLQAAEAIGETDALQYNEVVLENCWLGGDPEIKTNDLYFLEVVPALPKIVDFGRAEIKKL